MQSRFSVRISAKKRKSFSTLERVTDPKDLQYQTVSLFDILPDTVLDFHLYIYFKGNFLSYRKPGETLDSERFNRFVLKKIGKLFIPSEDYSKFQDYRKKNQANEAEQLNQSHLTTEQKTSIQLTKGLKAITQEVFLFENESELNQKLEIVMNVAQDTVQKALQMPYAKLFESIAPERTDIINHSVRVGLVATYLGYQLGFVNPIGLEYLAAAAMLHDLGKTKISELKDSEAGSPEETKILRQHPTLSVQMIAKSGFIPDEIKRIILEHHEEREGNGYPNGIRGPKILGLSKVFAIANTFDNLICEAKGDQRARTQYALEKLATMGNRFDLQLLPKAIKLLS